jgi:SHS2 domain-containing protein
VDLPLQRSHELLPHTADAGLRAEAADLRDVFEEAAIALGQMASEGARVVPLVGVEVDLSAPDLPALAFAWLNELIGICDARGVALGRVEVLAVEPTAGGWRLRGSAWVAPVDGTVVRRRADVKSATYHGLAVEPIAGGWRLTAYVDI